MGKSRFEKHCIVCGTRYEYCSNCDRFSRLPRWMESFHDDNCHKIFNTIMEYKAGVKTVDQAASILKKCDLSHRDTFNDGLNVYITAILAENKEAEQKAESIDIPEETYTVEPKAETEKPVEEKHSENKTEKKNFNYKKNYKK